jgi:tetratricopeptide (TPR) repeat protein
MHRLISILAASLLALALGAPENPTDLLRKASAAYSQGDFVSAIELLENAGDRIQDPGMVAFNKAAALYRMGEFRSAELHYRECLEDAEDSRLACTLYNLANCLVRENGAQDPTGLTQAIDLYVRCLEQPSTTAMLASDARYNLELAKLLLKNAKTDSSQRLNAHPPVQDDRAAGTNSDEALRGTDDRGRQGLSDNGQPKSGSDRLQGERVSDRRPRAGKGNVPPIPDRPDQPPLSVDEARKRLKEAAERIAGEAREHRLRSVRQMPPHVKNW